MPSPTASSSSAAAAAAAALARHRHRRRTVSAVTRPRESKTTGHRRKPLPAVRVEVQPAVHPQAGDACDSEESQVDRLIRKRMRLKAKLERTALRLAHSKSAQARRRARVPDEHAALRDDAAHLAPSWAHAEHHRDSNFTKGLLQSGYRGPGAFVTEKRQAFAFVDVDPAERALQARDRRSHGEFSHFLNRCINQCYQPRRGINDPRLDPDAARAAALAAAAAATAKFNANPPRPRRGEKPKYIGMPLAPVVPERYGTVTLCAVHENSQWQKLHSKPMDLAFTRDYKRMEVKNQLKGFLGSKK